MYEDELYHYGVLGQKWGVRKTRKKMHALAVKNEKLYAKREKQLAKADKKLSYAVKRSPDWGNKGKYQMAKAMRLTARANKNYKRMVRNDIKINELNNKLVNNGKEYVKRKYEIEYLSDKYKRIVDHNVYVK